MEHLLDHCHSKHPTTAYTAERLHATVTNTINAARLPPLSLPKQVAYHAAILAGRLLLTSNHYHKTDGERDPLGAREELLVAVAIFMACKSEECTRRCADIVAAVSAHLEAAVTVNDVVSVEPTALARTGFDFTVDTPYRHVIRGMANLADDAADKTDVVLEEAVKRVEWALARPIVYLYGPRVIGAAAVQWAASKAGLKIREDADWRCDQIQLAECVKLLDVDQ